MRAKSIYNVLFGLAIVLIGYGITSAQVVTAIKDTTVKAAKKTAEVTKDVAGKTKDVVTDGVEESKDAAKLASDKTYKTYKVVTEDISPVANEVKDKAVGAGKVATRTAAKVGDYTVDVTENVAGTAYEGGRWLTVTTWDGTKWVSKRAWFATKKAASATKDAVINQDEK